MEKLTLWFDYIEDFLWSYLASPLVLIMGLFFSFSFAFPQIRKIPAIVKTFLDSIACKDTKSKEKRGVTPLQAFFTSIGGCIGIANLVAVCLAIKVGGPGAIFWIWVAAFLGMTIKYCEVYLGVKFRVPNNEGGFDGGPMYYLQKVFKTSFVPVLVCVLLGLYGVEIYMFNVVTDSIVQNWGLNFYLVIFLLLAAIIFAAFGGIERVGKVSSIVIPLFLVLYIGMCLWVFMQNIDKIIPTFILIFKSAFNPKAAAIGGFTGTLLSTVTQGLTRGCYSSDIGVGYAAIVHAESSTTKPKTQALLSIFGVFLDSFVVCTSTAFLIIITDLWYQPILASQMVQEALSLYFGSELMSYFMPLFIFLLGYSTMIAFLTAGLKSASYISPKKGKVIYLILSSISFILFSFLDQSSALSLMAIVGGLLLLINLYGIFKLRHEVEF